MWTFTHFLYTPDFNRVALQFMPEQLARFYQDFVVQDPENPGNGAFRPIYRAIESLVICLLTRDHHRIQPRWHPGTFGDLFNFLDHIRISDPRLFFMAVNREPNGDRAFFPPVPLPGEPMLRSLLHLVDDEADMTQEHWASTPIRFKLFFRPLLQEFFSEDSGIDSE